MSYWNASALPFCWSCILVNVSFQHCQQLAIPSPNPQTLQQRMYTAPLQPSAAAYVHCSTTTLSSSVRTLFHYNPLQQRTYTVPLQPSPAAYVHCSITTLSSSVCTLLQSRFILAPAVWFIPNRLSENLRLYNTKRKLEIQIHQRSFAS